jgi:death-associated protein kinase
MHLDVVKYLVDTRRCDPLHPDKDSVTPLHVAAAEGQLEVVKYLVLSIKGNLSVRNRDNNTPLHFAAFHGHVEVVKFLTPKKCDPNCKGQYSRIPLHYASEKGYLDVVKYLVATCCCNPLWRDENELTSLFMAAYFHHLNVVEYFVEFCRIDPYLQPDMKTLLKPSRNSALQDFIHTYVDPLHNAAINGDLKSVRHYTEGKKWCPKKLDRHGNNVLHNAAQCGQLQVVKYLIMTPIFSDPLVTAQALAARGGHHSVVSFLHRSSTNQPVLEQYAISPIISIFVLGSSGSGKSTLIKALSTENT